MVDHLRRGRAVARVTSDDELGRLRALIADPTFEARFEVIGAAGTGGMGEVMRARARDDGRPLAIKLLAATGLSERARFTAEAEILERLDHPAIVGYVAHGVTGRGQPYLAMEWLDGETLADRLRGGPLAIDDAIALGQRLAAALAYAHGQGVIHRDVKPSNVILVGGAVAAARLIDFGVAKGHDRELTHTGQLIGTPGYMAPEQALGRRAVDGRADLFALGATLYQALAGAPPFAGDEVMAVLAQVLLHEPAPLTAVRPEVPPRLAHLIAALLAKQPDDRLADATVVEAELATMAAARAARDRATLALRPRLVPTTTVAVPRRARRGLTLAAALMVAGAIGLTVAWRAERSTGAGPPMGGAPAAGCDVDVRRGCAARCAAGDGEACYFLGEGHALGFGGLVKDDAAARTALTRGCDLGSGRACTKAATRGLEQLGRGGDDGAIRAAAAAVLRRGCDLGSGHTCRRLGLEYTSPDGRLGADDALAVDALTRGCELADYPSCWAVAGLLDAGRGPAIHRARATAAIAQACAQGAPHPRCAAAR